ncbi:helix-turn-helix domain-containing protein [Veillonella caviae]|uniref:helix-turn-helix transcriptional regulator n=1 Tax=Veillonella caviae TaxID=248316 RepID=UPI002A90F0EF|nr:helix-turn-helix domain-containing protein [Veillonella caviae]MDY5253706.1 helix-turn-helix domain-containing protein [Veillonella caviae]
MKRYAKLIGYRNQCGLSQKDIGSSLEISTQAYNAKENGKVKFTADDMKKIRDVLSDKLGKPLTIDELFF